MLKTFRCLNFRRRFCLVFGLVAFAVGVFINSTLGVALATVLILLSFVNEGV